MTQLNIKMMVIFCGWMSTGLKLISVTHGGQLWVVFVYSPGGPRKTTKTPETTQTTKHPTGQEVWW